MWENLFKVIKFFIFVVMEIIVKEYIKFKK